MTLTRKIYAGYAVAIVLLTILAGLAIYNMKGTESRYKSLMAEEVQLRYTSLQLRFQIRDTIANLRGGLLYPDRRQELIDKTTAGLLAADQAVALVEQAAASASRGTDLSKQIAAKEAAWHDGAGRALALLSAGDEKGALADAEGLVQPGTEIVDLAAQMVATAHEGVQTRMADIQKAINLSTAIIIGLAVFFIVGLLVLALAITRSVKRSLRGVTDKLASSAAEMLAVSSQVATSASETATSISETTSTVVEVKQTAQLVNEKAVTLLETAHETARIADAGSRAVDETVAGIGRMGEQMNVITDSIVRLSDQTSAIADVIATVNDLAEQSNLLSVNAAIEAAKAGDQGRGFAVVAQEVKNLADQSKQAVAQVRGILSDIEKATAATVMATELGSKSVENGARQSLEAGEAIGRLADSVAAAVQAIQQTAASTEQQFAGLDQISLAMDAINEASAQNVAGTRQIEAEVQHLRDMAAALRALVDRRAALPV